VTGCRSRFVSLSLFVSPHLTIGTISKVSLHQLRCPQFWVSSEFRSHPAAPIWVSTLLPSPPPYFRNGLIMSSLPDATSLASVAVTHVLPLHTSPWPVGLLSVISAQHRFHHLALQGPSKPKCPHRFLTGFLIFSHHPVVLSASAGECRTCLPTLCPLVFCFGRTMSLFLSRASYVRALSWGSLYV